MNRRFLAAFAALSILVALLTAASVAYRAFSVDAAGRKAARSDFEGLGSLLAAAHSASDLAGPQLRARLTAYYKASPSLLLIAVYERGAGVRWRIPAYSSYLPATENVRPAPEPLYPPRSALLLSAPLKGDPSGRLAVDALYTSLPQASLFLAFRDALLALGVYLALASIVLAIVAAARSGLGPRPDRDDPYPAEGSSGDAAAYDPPDEDFDIPDLHEQNAVEPSSISSSSPTGLYSPRSGLGWESYLSERLDAELARSASFEQDIGFLILSYDGLSPSSEAYPVVAKAVQDFFSFRDLAFEQGKAGFAVILPNMDVDHGLRMAEEFFKKLTFLLRDYRDPLEFLPLFVGLSSRAGRLVDAARVIEEAQSALDKAREDRDSHIVAFRPDPDKYRLFLASKGC